MRAAFELAGALGDEVLVAPGPQGATGHDLGSGPIAAGGAGGRRPVAAGPRVALLGGHDPNVRRRRARDDVVRWHNLCRDALARVLDALAPGVTGRELWEVCCDVFEAAGEPTQRDPQGQTPLRDGFFHSSATASGSRSTRRPAWGAAARRSSPGDVVAIEPGLYRHGYGGVRIEDLFLVTEDGSEALTSLLPEAILRP